MWLLTISPHLEYAATLPCNLSLPVCFLTLIFYEVVWKHNATYDHFTAKLLWNLTMKEL